MEDVYTVKVKTKPDSRNLYPSERRYSASTVSGLSWVHVALAATSLLLSCLTIIGPQTEVSTNSTGNKYVLVTASSLVSVFGSLAGLAGAFASARWYESKHIGRFLAASILSAVAAISAAICTCCALLTLPNEDLVIIKTTDVLIKNDTHLVLSLTNAETHSGFTLRVMAINILIASVLELLWSLLCIKISYKGMKNDYEQDKNIPVTEKEVENQAPYIDNLNTQENECYRERIKNFLNCSSENESRVESIRDCNSPVSWGDTTDRTVYNQNTINFDKIFTFNEDKVDKVDACSHDIV